MFDYDSIGRVYGPTARGGVRKWVLIVLSVRCDPNIMMAAHFASRGGVPKPLPLNMLMMRP